MKRFSAFLAAAALVCAGCSSSGDGNGGSGERSLSDQVQDTITVLQTRDPGLARWFSSAYGYAVFPNVAKGGLVVGAAHGRGQVFEQGNYIGDAELSQGSVGLQVGGQAYREVIFFKDKAALDTFTGDSFEFAGNASAVMVDAGASTAADYSNGVAVFTMHKSGAMLEASIGGQQFNFTRR